MKLPYGANEDDFENIKKIVSEFTGGDYSDETLLAYVKAYFEMNSTNQDL